MEGLFSSSEYVLFRFLVTVKKKKTLLFFFKEIEINISTKKTTQKTKKKLLNFLFYKKQFIQRK